MNVDSGEQVQNTVHMNVLIMQGSIGQGNGINSIENKEMSLGYVFCAKETYYIQEREDI